MLIGIGTMMCINKIEFDDTQVKSIMKQTVSDMVLGCKERKLRKMLV